MYLVGDMVGNCTGQNLACPSESGLSRKACLVLHMSESVVFKFGELLGNLSRSPVEV